MSGNIKMHILLLRVGEGMLFPIYQRLMLGTCERYLPVCLLVASMRLGC